MEDFSYPDNISKISKKNKNFNLPHYNDEGSFSLRDCLHEKWKFISQEDITKAYCHDLISAIEGDSIKEIVQKILEVENNLSQVRERLDDDDPIEVPKLEEFYKALSPIFLRSLLEMPNKISEDMDETFKGWIEALRVAVEEEIYSIKEEFNQER
jgi:hypothetical protein